MGRAKTMCQTRVRGTAARRSGRLSAAAAADPLASKKPARRFLDIPAEKPKATGLFNGFWVPALESRRRVGPLLA